MKNRSELTKVAVIQASPVLFNKDATLEKACGLIREAGKHDSRLVLLPEAFIPAYPKGLSFGMVVGSTSQMASTILVLLVFRYILVLV